MADRFDEHAKKSARAATPGVSRRRVVIGGSAAVGAAWTAPILMGVQPAYAGASVCTAKETYVTCPGGTTFKCCPTGEQCFESPPGTFICQPPLGGVCGNQGNGQCAGNTSRCNQPTGPPATNPSICGGTGTICSDGSVCLRSCVNGVCT